MNPYTTDTLVYFEKATKEDYLRAVCTELSDKIESLEESRTFWVNAFIALTKELYAD